MSDRGSLGAPAQVKSVARAQTGPIADVQLTSFECSKGRRHATNQRMAPDTGREESWSEERIEAGGLCGHKEERERRSEVGRLVRLCKPAAHGPRALRPFPDADATVSRSGSSVRQRTRSTSKNYTMPIYPRDLSLLKQV